ncbi:MAG: formate dehydrogenase subunit delta [Xanthobacteraceae bacterium]
MSLDKLIYMANQIGKFFASQGTEKAAVGTADHIKKFWDPRMRAQIIAHLQAGGAGLDPAVRAAIESLAEAKLKVPGQETRSQ